MKNLLEFILIHLVDNPDQVSIDVHEDGDMDIYTIHVASEDMGKVIGKQGKVINALRTVARVRAIKENKHIMVNIADEAPQAVEA
ncbi:RNA-binding protein [Candidatus Cerribacteria bacterium 'Amazon FNV 2010 28 9']|uniref:RNA-binding protein KhpA n=1 Tax=Candidatus Cerribacteria bacterium 'Amazon FNV 2010 28 9' TaxID=2081795 RepID=A0A317JST7_9BACT|nr:MAG: RNA-binding protein [Candidatus Cerribacteria bacterium 'Amazon FNV 2010 28 9']